MVTKTQESQQLPVTDSVKLFFQSLLATEKHGAPNNEKSSRLIESFAAMIYTVTNGSILTTKHFLLALRLYSVTGMRQIIQILHMMGHFFFFFFNCYLAAPRPTSGHYRGDSLTHPMLITAFLHIRPEGHREPRSEVGSLSPAERLVGFEPGTFRF